MAEWDDGSQSVWFFVMTDYTNTYTHKQSQGLSVCLWSCDKSGDFLKASDRKLWTHKLCRYFWGLFFDMMALFFFFMWSDWHQKVFEDKWTCIKQKGLASDLVEVIGRCFRSVDEHGDLILLSLLSKQLVVGLLAARMSCRSCVSAQSSLRLSAFNTEPQSCRSLPVFVTHSFSFLCDCRDSGERSNVSCSLVCSLSELLVFSVDGLIGR